MGCLPIVSKFSDFLVLSVFIQRLLVNRKEQQVRSELVVTCEVIIQQTVLTGKREWYFWDTCSGKLSSFVVWTFSCNKIAQLYFTSSTVYGQKYFLASLVPSNHSAFLMLCTITWSPCPNSDLKFRNNDNVIYVARIYYLE